MRRVVPLLTGLLLITATGCPFANSKERFSGAGATFIKPIMQKWAYLFGELHHVDIGYEGTGSSGGIRQLTEGTVDFGCTDAPMTEEQFVKAQESGKGDPIHVPLTMGAVAVVYHLPGVEELKLTGPVIADIYAGKITTWNDPQIRDLNEGVTLPKTRILPVARKEGSGTTEIFTEYLCKMSDEYAQAIGGPNKEKVLVGNLGQKEQGNDGVAGLIERSAGTIGYVNLNFAKNLQIAFVKNRAGVFVTPEPESVTAAAEAALREQSQPSEHRLHELAFSLTDADGEQSYPICGFSYGMLFSKQPAGKGELLVAFFKWCATEGQQNVQTLDYAPLPKSLQERVVDKLTTIEIQE